MWLKDQEIVPVLSLRKLMQLYWETYIQETYIRKLIQLHSETYIRKLIQLSSETDVQGLYSETYIRKSSLFC